MHYTVGNFKGWHFINLSALLYCFQCCWLGGRKGIRPVKTEQWGAGMVICLERGADAYGPADATATHSLAPVKSRLVLPFWYRLTQVVLDKGPLNGCVCFIVLLVYRCSYVGCCYHSFNRYVVLTLFPCLCVCLSVTACTQLFVWSFFKFISFLKWFSK